MKFEGLPPINLKKGTTVFITFIIIFYEILSYLFLHVFFIKQYNWCEKLNSLK